MYKRQDLGRYLKIPDIKTTYRGVATKSRLELSEPKVFSKHLLLQRRNNQDAFVDLEGALEIVVRSRKPKAVELTKWLNHKGVEKLVEDHQSALGAERQEKDMQLALLSDDLALEQEHARQLDQRVTQLQCNNTGLQGEIRAKDQEIARRQSEIAELRERYVDHCRDPRKDNTVMITRKHTTDEDDEHFEYPYYISRIQRCKIPTKRRWLLTQFPDSEEIVVIDNPNSVHAFNRLEEEGHVERYGCHFKLIDLTREDLYDMGVPSIKE